MKATTLTIFVSPLIGDEIRIEKACTLKQAVTLAKKEARKMIRENNDNAVIMINILGRSIYNTVETLAHIEATPAGRRVAFTDEQPAESYAVCWGDEYKEEGGESNAIAETTNEEDAKELAENESKSNKCRMCVVRKSDGKVIAAYATPATMNETNTVEFSELSHAGQCTDIYLHNTAEIYERYTVEAVRYAAGLAAFGWGYVTETLMNGAKVKGVKVVDEAINAAVKLVRKYDHLTPTAKDIEPVMRNYAAYIVECAKYEVENA